MLTDLQIERLKPREKPYKAYDHGGLYLRIFPNGRCYWFCRYQMNGKERHVSLGIYPDVTLSQARTMCTHVKIQRYQSDDLKPVFQLTKFYLDGVPHTDENIAEAVRVSSLKARGQPSTATLKEQISVLGKQIEHLTSAIMTLTAALK